MRTKPRPKLRKLNTIIPIVLVVLDLLLVWFIKYEHHKLALSEFRLTYIGNLLNLIFAFILILGLSILPFVKNEMKNSVLMTYSVLMTFFLVAGIIATFIKIPYAKYYILDHPFPEVLTGFLFCAFQYLQFVFLSTVWINIIGGKELVFLNSSVNGVIILLLFFFFSFIYLNRNIKINQLSNHSNNIAVVLGAAVWSKNEPSPSLASRVDKAAFLYRSKIADKIQLTGSNAPGELSEAEVAYKRLRNKNIDSTDILLEKKTTSTTEQVKFIKDELISKRKFDNIIIVSDSYHLTRVNEICDFYNIKADIIASDLNLSFEHKIYYKIRESIALMIFWFFAL